jgi:hypothetical protein
VIPSFLKRERERFPLFVPKRSRSNVPNPLHESFLPFQERLQIKTVLKRSETVMKRVRNSERLGTFMLYTINGSKRFHNQVHGTVMVRSRKLFKNERITVLYKVSIYLCSKNPILDTYDFIFTIFNQRPSLDTN